MLAQAAAAAANVQDGGESSPIHGDNLPVHDQVGDGVMEDSERAEAALEASAPPSIERLAVPATALSATQASAAAALDLSDPFTDGDPLSVTDTGEHSGAKAAGGFKGHDTLEAERKPKIIERIIELISAHTLFGQTLYGKSGSR